FGGFLALLYVATGRLSLVGAGAGLFGLGAWFFSNHIQHVHSRVEIWLHPFRPDLVENKAYQIAQGLFAQADGGLFGKGFSQSLLELPGGHTILPAPHTDLIYAVITDETGLFGACALIIAYLLFVRRGFKTALLSGDGFGKLLATGLTAVFAAKGLQDNPHNRRNLLEQLRHPRGLITADNGTVLASNRSTGQGETKRYFRTYPQGGLFSHAVGYFFISKGDAGLEHQYDD